MWEKFSFLKNELTEFESYMNGKYPVGRAFIDDLSHDAIFSGGKRIRPALVIITSMMGDYKREVVFPAAAAIETLHTATLIHDDIIDNAACRRGKPTITEKHGVNLAVYTGDYLLAKSMLLLAESGLPADMLKFTAKAAKIMCIGEVNQYINRYNVTSIGSYIRRIMKKTGILFVASCVCGTYAAGLSEDQMNKMARFGLNLGVAFQIRDDLLDIESDYIREGKPVKNDLNEGIATLPFIYSVMKDESVRKQLKGFYDGFIDIKDVIKTVKETGGTEDAKRLKNRYIKRCRDILSGIPQYECLGAMEEILSRL